MDLNELAILINKKYNCRLWKGKFKCRLYFDYKSNVTVFLELKLIDNKVVKAIPKCIYKLNYDLSQRWINNHVAPSWEYISRLASEVMLLISSFDTNITACRLSKRTIIKQRAGIRD